MHILNVQLRLKLLQGPVLTLHISVLLNQDKFLPRENLLSPLKIIILPPFILREKDRWPLPEMLWCALTELIGGLTSERALYLPGLIFSLFILYHPERQKHLTDAPQTCIVFPNIFTLWYSSPPQNLTTSSILNIKYLLPAEDVVCFPLT